MRTVEECRRLFAEFAFEEAGQLRAPVTFLPRLLRNAGCMPTTKDLQEIVREVNTNADGMLSFDDFLLYYSQTCTSVPSHADVQAALSEFFPEGQEAISSQALLSQLEEILPPEEAAELVALLGAGTEGRIHRTQAAMALLPPPSRRARILVLFYSAFGHNHLLAAAAAQGARRLDGVEVDLLRFPETLSVEQLRKSGALHRQEAFASLPEARPQGLAAYDGFVFSFPTRFGMVPAQVQAFFDATGGLWKEGALVGKVASVMTSSATQHGGNEATLLNFLPTLYHHGIVVVGLPYSYQGQQATTVCGCSPYGTTTIAGPKGDRLPSKPELDAAAFQGKHTAQIAIALARP
eukprot:TRINITY_DN12310_c0_g1_i2.p1 TRINITY_DN12310_c0_g1~~TRINITY_DN12310_c0_g1_i2.p1  ORF type:complete len:358 (-),score=47.34 TRINITY_DN12310_c0_g1_i2:31-1080(-)